MTLDEIEQELSPDLPRAALKKRATTARSDTKDAANADPSNSASGSAKPRLQLLLEHAFGKQMLEGRDEWRDVADVIRSSFLVVAEELKRHDKRLRLVEANSSHHYHQQYARDAEIHQQKESDVESRWCVLQAQMALFGDELQLLTQQLQQMKERQHIAQEQLTVKDDLELGKSTGQRAEESHARLKRRLARLEANAKHAIERAENIQSSVHIVESKLGAVATELRDLKQVVRDKVAPKRGTLEDQVGELRLLLRDATKVTGNATDGSARSDLAALGDQSLRHPDKIRELFAAQTQCKQEIRRLQHALVAHDQRTMAQAKEIKRRVAKIKHRSGAAANQDGNTVVKNQTKPPFISVEARDPRSLSQPKDVLKTELPIQDVHVTDSEQIRSPPPSVVVVALVSGSHATLNQRFAKARQKQQESLNQLREQQHQHQQHHQV